MRNLTRIAMIFILVIASLSRLRLLASIVTLLNSSGTAVTSDSDAGVMLLPPCQKDAESFWPGGNVGR